MVAYRNLFVRSVRRVRLEFSSDLAAGAFAAAFYSLTCEDDSTGDPEVVAALPVPGLANYVELALGQDLAGGGIYTLQVAAGVPATDLSAAAAAEQLFHVPAPNRTPSTSLSARELSDIIFQEDIAHHPVFGHIEAPDGDLAVVTGPENAQLNGQRALASSGLPHRVNWGADLRVDVDAPNVPATRLALRGKAEQQLRRDDRVTACRAVVEDLGGGELVVNADVEFVGQVKSNIRSTINAGR